MLGSRNAFEALFEDGDVLSSRRHGVANLVREVWTIGTAKESLMAPHFFDGTYNTLESYIVEGGLWLVDFFAAAPRRHNCQEQPECMHYPAIPVVDVADGFSKKKFIEEFMSCNQPVLIQNATAEWPANREWTEESGKNTRAKHVRPATAAIQEKYGTSEVEVEDAPNGDRSASNSGGGNDKTNNYVEGINYGYERPRRRILLADYEVASGLYIKDWHFHANYPEDAAQLCPLPTFFSDDWLNNYATSAEKTSFGSISDYRFVYFGRAGTRTHLHSDVLGSFSWSTNICGQKRWRFLCPELTYLLRDVFGSALAPEFIGSGLEIDQDGHDCPSASLSAPEPNLTLRDSLWRFPLLTAASPWVIELRQGVGDAIFVPSEWHHTVMNEADTLSVNQNWFNRCVFVLRIVLAASSPLNLNAPFSRRKNYLNI